MGKPDDSIRTSVMLVEKNADDEARCRPQQIPLSDLPDLDVLVDVHFSALNYKDALAATGHPGVALTIPLVPGIDAVGTIVESRDNRFAPGDTVVIKGADFGTRSHGGWAGFACVRGDWCYPLPDGLSEKEAATLGTAGFTAAQCVDQLRRHGVATDSGPIVVTGATGGVGIFAVKMLAKLGYEVVASTGKTDQAARLRELGAADVIGRGDVDDSTDRPLLSGRWAGAVDTVGGNTLATVLRGAKNRACVTACGLVAGAQLEMTVHPFILRGVALQGIDSANTTRHQSERIWSMLGNELRVDGIDALAECVKLQDVMPQVERILQGKVFGRVVVETPYGIESTT